MLQRGTGHRAANASIANTKKDSKCAAGSAIRNNHGRFPCTPTHRVGSDVNSNKVRKTT